MCYFVEMFVEMIVPSKVSSIVILHSRDFVVSRH